MPLLQCSTSYREPVSNCLVCQRKISYHLPISYIHKKQQTASLYCYSPPLLPASIPPPNRGYHNLMYTVDDGRTERTEDRDTLYNINIIKLGDKDGDNGAPTTTKLATVACRFNFFVVLRGKHNQQQRTAMFTQRYTLEGCFR